MCTPIGVDHLLRLLPRNQQADADLTARLGIEFVGNAQLRRGDTQPVVNRMRPAEILRKVELVRVPRHRPQTRFFVERHARVVADVHVSVVVPRTPFAGKIDLRVCRRARDQ